MKIKVTDEKIQRLRDEAKTTSGVLNNLGFNEEYTAAHGDLDKAVKPLCVKLNAALDKAQSGARVRTLSPYNLEIFANKAEELLDSLEIPQKLRKGCRFKAYAEEGSIANAYKYGFAVSSAVLQRGSGGKAWFLINAGRAEFYGGNTISNKLHLNTAARVHKLRKLNRQLVGGVAA